MISKLITSNTAIFISRFICTTLMLISINAGAYEYRIMDLGSLGDTSENIVNVLPGGLNDHGVVSGTIVTNSSSGISRHALMFDHAPIQLGSLGGSAFAYGVNNARMVVGASYLADNFTTDAVLWNGSDTTDLGTLGGNFSVANAINDKQEIVGRSALYGSLLSHATIWKDGQVFDLGSLYVNSSSAAASINIHGEIVGNSENFSTGRNTTHATLWADGTLLDLGTLGGGYSYASSINDRGQVVGSSSLNGSFEMHASLWQDGSIIDLGTIGNGSSSASDINNAGVIVGTYYLSAQTNETSAALWRNGELLNINELIAPDSGWHLSEANQVNDLGQILGAGYYNGEYRIYLLSPIPEPESYAMMLVGLGLIGFLSRRRV